MLTRPNRRRPRPSRRDTLLWVLARQLVPGWRRHRRGWRLLWRWRSRPAGGRPRLSGEARDLTRSMSRDGRLWGAARIRGELLKLGIVVSNRSIRRYRWRGAARPPSASWRAFLANHRHELLAPPWAGIDDVVERRAADGQRQLARTGHHRLPPVDILLAALADRHGLGILHDDRDYDLIAARTDLRFASKWLAPADSL